MNPSFFLSPARWVGLLALALGAILPVSAAEPLAREQLVALVTRTLKAWEAGDAAAFTGAFTADAVWAYPGGKIPRDQFAGTFADLLARKRDIKIYLGDFVIRGEEFAAQYQFAATDRKTGKRWAVGTGIRGRVKDGKIAVLKEYWDEHIPVFQLAKTMPLDEGQPFPAPASVIMDGERIN
jgi:ketosteroid isomerase-like protein